MLSVVLIPTLDLFAKILSLRQVENTLEPPNLPRLVPTAGIGWFSLLTYAFNLLRCTQTLALPLLFGVTTMGVHQSLGW